MRHCQSHSQQDKGKDLESPVSAIKCSVTLRNLLLMHTTVQHVMKDEESEIFGANHRCDFAHI